MLKLKAILITCIALMTVTNLQYAQQVEKKYKPDEVDVIPTFPGGKKAFTTFIQKNVKYPMEALISNQKGVVYVSYLVMLDGSVKGVKSIKIMELLVDENGKKYESKKKLDPIKSLQDEAERVVKLFPKHAPGKKNKKNVIVEMETKLNFFAAGK